MYVYNIINEIQQKVISEIMRQEIKYIHLKFRKIEKNTR
jgi:hypothetical protein